MRTAEILGQPDTLHPCVQTLDQHLRGSSLAVMLYGSQARGDARVESDVDVLQLVEHDAHSYSLDSLNVSVYTVEHLFELARRGSLFVRHLRDEGVVISDPSDALGQVLSAYREPASYDALRSELAVLTASLRLPGANEHPHAARRAAVFTVRSLLYAACADRGLPVFDVVEASCLLGRPDIGAHLRSPEPALHYLLDHCAWLLHQSGTSTAFAPWRTFDEAVVWAAVASPAAGALLESVLAGDSTTEYTSLTLPIS